MILFWIIYILGVVATILLLYCGLERGAGITVGEIALALAMSVFSWVSFFIIFILFFADRVVFTKK